MVRAPWVERVDWVRGSASEPRTYQHLLPGALGAVSCVGAFGSQAHMLQVGLMCTRGCCWACAAKEA